MSGGQTNSIDRTSRRLTLCSNAVHELQGDGHWEARACSKFLCCLLRLTPFRGCFPRCAVYPEKGYTAQGQGCEAVRQTRVHKHVHVWNSTAN